MYPQNPYPEGDKRHDAWESVNHPHGEEYPGQHDEAKRILREDRDYDDEDNQ